MPTTEDVRKAGESARAALAGALEQARTPLLAALGAGDLATQAIIEAVGRARAQLTERAEAVRSAVDELPTDMSSLRDKFDPTELSNLVEQYGDAAVQLYRYLAEQGEKTLAKLREQPQLAGAMEQLDQAMTAASRRAETAVDDARELADDVLDKVVRRNRDAAEKAAEVATEHVEATTSQRSTTRGGTSKAASKTSAAGKTSGGTNNRATSRKKAGN